MIKRALGCMMIGIEARWKMEFAAIESAQKPSFSCSLRPSKGCLRGSLTCKLRYESTFDHALNRSLFKMPQAHLMC